MPVSAAVTLLSHAERVNIEAPLDAVLSYVDTQPLKRAIQGSSLRHVTGTYDLTPVSFETVGTRRLTCLSDGSSLVEQVLVRQRAGNTARFRYVAWDYNSPAARPVRYAIGSFERIGRGPRVTETRWTYSFALRDGRVPGAFGKFGRYLFRKTFLERDFAGMMRRTLAAEKKEGSRRRPLVGPGVQRSADKRRIPARAADPAISLNALIVSQPRGAGRRRRLRHEA